MDPVRRQSTSSAAPTILRFFGGFVAFPGGKVGEEDAALSATAPGLTRQHVAAVRELFEETGVLLAHIADGSFPAASPELALARQELNAGRLTFTDFLMRFGLSLSAADLCFAGTLVTPPFSPIRFATTFFTANLPAGQVSEVWPGELAEGFWSDARSALDDWTRGGLLLSPPTVVASRSDRGPADRGTGAALRRLLAMLETGVIPPIWFGAGLRMLPLACRGLPPATHTNAFLVGTESPYLIDPGPADADEQQRLLVALDEALTGRRLAGVVLTHHHGDHIGAATVCAERYHAPILAHALTTRLLEDKVKVDRHLADGDRLDLGPAPDGSGRWHLEALHTPGHAPDHLVFWDPKYRRLFAGDMVSTLSSIVIAPPQGDLTVYLESLRRLLTYPARLLLPSHGSPSARPTFLLEEALSHRAKRETQLLAALAEGPRRVTEMSREIYRGLPSNLMQLGELQLLAGLRKLERESRVVEMPNADGSSWALTPVPPQ